MRLTSKQTDQLRAGGAPRLTFPGDEPCPVEPGHVIPVCSNLELIVQRIRRSRGGEHVAVYAIRDFRVRLPRRVPPAHVSGRGHLDEHGMPAAPTAEEIERARVEGGSTSSKRMAVRGHDLAENLEEEEQRSVTAKAHARWAMHKRDTDAEREADKDLQRVNAELRELIKRAMKMGVDPAFALAPVAREIRTQHRQLSDAA